MIQLPIHSDIELNALQVAVDALVEQLTDIVPEEEPSERHVTQERLDAALQLKQRLHLLDWPEEQ